MPSSCGEADPRVGQRPVHHRADGPDVRPARQLGHHPAEDAVHVLRQDHEAGDRADAALGAEHRRGGLVAGCLDAEDPARHASSSGWSRSRSTVPRLAGELQSCAPITRLTRMPRRSSRKLSGTPVVW